MNTSRSDESRRATVGQILAERVAAAGVRRVFGFPGGGSNLDLIESFERAGVGFVLAHTEGGATFMAAAAAERTGVPGVLLVGNGPGLTSAVNGVAHAYLDRVPLLVVSDRSTDVELRSSGHQVLEHRALLAPVVKWGVTLAPESARDAVERALDVCCAPPAGPVHLDLPRDHAARLGGARAPASAEPTGAAPHDLAAIADALWTARRPLLLVGLEANHGLDGDTLQRLAERLQAPVLTTYKAKGTFPEGHELWAGILTGGALEAPLLEAADACLAIGLDPVELLTRPWPVRTHVLSLRTSGSGPDHPPARHVAVGPLGPAVGELLQRLDGRSASAWRPGHAGEHRERALARLRIGADGVLTSWRVVEAVAAEVGPDTVVAVDAGAHMFAATWFWRSTTPRRFLISNGLASMGFAVPAAIGAAAAEPGSIAVALTGDGGMAYHAFELETALRIGARVVVVVLNDSSLSLIRIKQEAQGRPREVLDFGETRFDRLGQSLGARGVVATTEPEVRAAIRDALEAPTSTVVDVRVTGGEYGATLVAIRG